MPARFNLLLIILIAYLTMFSQFAQMQQEVEWPLHMMKWQTCENSRGLYIR